VGAARRVGALQDLQVQVGDFGAWMAMVVEISGDFGMETYPKII
jgi:hypothetical protein